MLPFIYVYLIYQIHVIRMSFPQPRDKELSPVASMSGLNDKTPGHQVASEQASVNLALFLDFTPL